MSRKLTYEFVKAQFRIENYELLTKEYKNNMQKLDYICSKGHAHSISWNKWKRGVRCKHCAIARRANVRRKYDINFIKYIFRKEK